MKVPDAADLLAALLLAPGTVTRFPVGKPQPQINMMCACGDTPKVGANTNLNPVPCTHKLYSSAELSGHVWVGRCSKCGHWFYGARRDKAIMPRKALIVKRHKIVTRQK